jgi:hypothetical protein
VVTLSITHNYLVVRRLRVLVMVDKLPSPRYDNGRRIKKSVAPLLILAHLLSTGVVGIQRQEFHFLDQITNRHTLGWSQSICHIKESYKDDN